MGIASRMYSAPEPTVQMTAIRSHQTATVNGPMGATSTLPGPV